MTAEELKRAGAIYFENIEEGLRGYRNEIHRISAPAAFNMFRKMCEERGWEDVYVDFYYYTLEKTAQEFLSGLLNENERQYLERFRSRGEALAGKNPAEVFFPLDETLLAITAKFNEKEALFSTFYFAGERKIRSTWWGNFNQEYIVFRD